jgi:hypothetical protein
MCTCTKILPLCMSIGDGAGICARVPDDDRCSGKLFAAIGSVCISVLHIAMKDSTEHDYEKHH